MAWPVRALLALISLPIFSVCAATLYYYHVKDREWRKYLKNIQKLEVEMNIPLSSVGELIGRGGETIRDLQEKTQTKISLKTSREDDQYRICRVFGTKENIELATNLITEIINPKDIDIMEMWVPENACGIIIGRCGDNILAIRRASNAKIFVDRAKKRGSKVLVVIRGKEHEISNAKKLIDEKISELQKNQRPRSPRSQSRNQQGNGVAHKIPPHEEMNANTSDGMISVYVSSVESPTHFWLQLVTPRSVELDLLVEYMTDYYSQPEHQKMHSLKEVKKGQIVASKFQHDGKWYRVEVFSVEMNDSNPDESQVSVFYVDYGDLAVYRLGDLLELKPEHFHLKFQAIEVSMRGILPKDEKWSEDATETFSDMVYSAQWKTLLAQVVCRKEMEGAYKKEPVPFIRLYDPDGPQGVDIGSQFIEKGFALRDETDHPENNYDGDDEDETLEIWTA